MTTHELVAGLIAAGLLLGVIVQIGVLFTLRKRGSHDHRSPR